MLLTSTALTVGDLAKILAGLPEELIVLNAYTYMDRLALTCEDSQGEIYDYSIEATVKDED